jgi:hypothetical protein
MKPMQMALAVAQARMPRIVDGPGFFGRARRRALRFSWAGEKCRRMLRLAALACAMLAFAACGTTDGPLLCREIPEGGCPIGRGGTCEDRLCSGLYDCVDGSWTLVTECHQGGGGGGAGGAGAGGGGAGGCEVIALDHTGEETGCEPELQDPDCPAAAAETCVWSACLTGCLDFFLCKSDGWVLVAYCTEEGQVVILQ